MPAVMFVVVSRGGRNASGDPDPRWFAEYGDGLREIKRRLGVRSLHKAAHGVQRQYLFGPDESRRSYEGREYRPDEAEHYSAVTRSHADTGRSGGHSLYTMVPLDVDSGSRTAASAATGVVSEHRVSRDSS